MKRRILCSAALALALSSPAYANPHVDRVIEQLKTEGFSSFETESTWLGRIRIEADKGDQEREIVLNRATGEILRDYTVFVEAHEFEDDDEDDDLEDEEIEDMEFEEGEDEDWLEEEDEDEEDEDEEDDEDEE